METELADPANPLLVRDREQSNVDPGELLKGLVDVKTRLGKFSVGHQGRVRLVQGVLQDPPQVDHDTETIVEKNGDLSKDAEEPHKSLETARGVAGLDRRIGELERLVGSASTSLDEVLCYLFILRQNGLNGDIDTELRNAHTATTTSHSVEHATYRACAASAPRQHLTSSQTAPVRPRSIGSYKPTTPS